MPKKCLITTSLIGGIDWAQTAPNSIIKKEKGGDGSTTWAQKGILDLKATLAREGYEMNQAAQRGIWFENAVYDAARSCDVSKGSDKFKSIVELCIGGEFQKKISKEYVVDGETCFLYGIEDVRFPDNIKDLKTTATFKTEKYTASFQHPLYCFIEGLYEFEYIVAEWSKYPEIKKIHRIPLHIDPVFAERLVNIKITEAFNYMKSHGLWEIYRDKFCKY